MNGEEARRWAKTLLLTLAIFAAFSIYLYVRRGYYNLYIINKVFGSSAAVLAGITLLIGPLEKIYKSLTPLMTIRRHLGLTAFGLAVLHIIASLLQQNRFPLFAWYLREWIPVSFGILAIGIWIYMTFISRNEKIKEMGVEAWKRALSIAGQVAFVAIFLHLTIMKYPGWIRWFNGQVRQTPELANPSMPPASIFVFIIMLVVILYRVKTFFWRSNTTAA